MKLFGNDEDFPKASFITQHSISFISHPMLPVLCSSSNFFSSFPNNVPLPPCPSSFQSLQSSQKFQQNFLIQRPLSLLPTIYCSVLRLQTENKVLSYYFLSPTPLASNYSFLCQKSTFSSEFLIQNQEEYPGTKSKKRKSASSPFLLPLTSFVVAGGEILK